MRLGKTFIQPSGNPQYFTNVQPLGASVTNSFLLRYCKAVSFDNSTAARLCKGSMLTANSCEGIKSFPLMVPSSTPAFLMYKCFANCFNAVNQVSLMARNTSFCLNTEYVCGNGIKDRNCSNSCLLANCKFCSE